MGNVKKVSESKKKETKELKPQVKKKTAKKEKVEIKIEDEKMPKLRELSSTTKLLSILGMFFSTIMVILTTINCTLTSLSINAFSKEKLINNETVINYLSKINLYGFTDAKEAITNIENKGAFIAFDVIIPSILVLCMLFTIGYGFYQLYELSKKMRTKKSFFTNDNLEILKRIRLSFLYIGLLFILVFDVSYYIIVIFTIIMIELLVFVFDYVIKKESEKVKE